MQKETYHENQQNEIFKIRDVQNMLQKKVHPIVFVHAHSCHPLICYIIHKTCSVYYTYYFVCSNIQNKTYTHRTHMQMPAHAYPYTIIHHTYSSLIHTHLWLYTHVACLHRLHVQAHARIRISICI